MAVSLIEHSATETGPLPVAANTRIESGGIFCVNAAGQAVPGGDAAAVRIAGRAEAEFDNRTSDDHAGLAGDIQAHGKLGVFCLANSTGAAVTAASFGKVVFLENAFTARADNDGPGSVVLPVAGLCRGMRDGQVIVDLRQAAAFAEALTAANAYTDAATA